MLGLSLKTQILYLVVFVARYLDLFVRWVSLYNTVMKLFFIGSSAYIVYLMCVKYKSTYEHEKDSFPIEYLLGGCGVLSLIFTYAYDILEV